MRRVSRALPRRARWWGSAPVAKSTARSALVRSPSSGLSGRSCRTRSLRRVLWTAQSLVRRSQARTRRSKAACSWLPSSSGSRPWGPTMGSMASVRASMLLDLAWRDRNRRRSWALAEADAVDEVAAADEIDGDGPPGRAGWLHNHLQSSLLRSAFQSRLLQLQQAIQAGPAAATTDLGAIGAEHLGGVRGGDPEVDTDQTTFMHDVVPRSVAGGRLPTAHKVTLLAGHGPTMVEPGNGSHTSSVKGSGLWSRP